MQKVYKLAHQATATTNSAATVTIARKGTLVGIVWAVFVNAGAASSSLANELSFSNTGQVATNDTIGPIGAAHVGCATSTVNSLNVGEACRISVNAGDRIYLNTLVTGTIAASYTQCFLLVDE